MKRHRLRHLWLILAAYGVWFAALSGLEELFRGKLWKVILSLAFGFAVYLVFEVRENR